MLIPAFVIGILLQAPAAAQPQGPAPSNPVVVEKGTRPPVRNEATNGLSNQRGTVAMARTSAVRSATSQFFINLADNSKLDHRGFSPDDYGYAVFGRVVGGMDVVDRIAAVATTSRDGMADVPETPIVIR